MKLRILLADDHEIVRRGLRALLEKHEGWEVCGEASDGRECVEKALQLNPDVVIVDIGMPNLNGLDTTRQLLQHDPHFKVIVLTITDSDQVIREALDAGACGFVLKSDAARASARFPLFANGVARKHTTVPDGHIRIYPPLAFEELLPSRPLRILPVADLEPLRRVPQVGPRTCALRDALRIVLAELRRWAESHFRNGPRGSETMGAAKHAAMDKLRKISWKFCRG